MLSSNRSEKLVHTGGITAIVLGLYLSSLPGYLLFHSLVEIITIAVAFTLFVLIWNTRRYLTNNYLRLLGIGYGFIALIDLLHTLAYKGMNVFPGFDANLPTQLWIAARYLQALALLAAPLLMERRVGNHAISGVYAAAVSLLVALVFSGNFPDCFIEGKGLTPFKISSEYVITALLLASLYFLYRKRQYFNDRVFYLTACSIVCTVFSEIAFTAYVSVYGFANMFGHFAKLAAFYLIYRAILVTGLKEPFELIFRELKQAEEALRISEERFRAMLENSQVALYKRDYLTNTYEYVSAAIFNILGYTPEEMQAKSEEEMLTFVHPDDVPVVKDALSKAMVTDGNATIEYRFRHKNGRMIWLNDVCKMYFDSSGKPIYSVGNIQDITERKRLEDDLRQSQKMETVGLLAGGVAHDFNNLLTPIIGYTDLLLLGLPEGDHRREQLQQVKQASERAKDLTRRLLAFSRKQLIELKTVDLGDLIRRFEAMLHRTIRENIKIEPSISPSLSKVRADAGQIEQALLNLAINAQDAMPEGGQLTIEAKDIDLDASYTSRHPEIVPGPYVMLAVSDTGVGMNEKGIEHIFEPFFTTKELGKGTGLGLSTAYGIVRQHGGSISVHSEKGRGSIFKVFLPRVSEEGRMIEERPLPPDEVARGVETILVAEDNEMARNLVCKMLENLGYRVLSAESPDRCIELVHEHTGAISLLLTDVVMPKMTGKELFELVHRTRPDIKVLFMSGYTSNVIGHHGVLDKGVNFIQKPFSIHALSQKVRQALDSQQ